MKIRNRPILAGLAASSLLACGAPPSPVKSGPVVSVKPQESAVATPTQKPPALRRDPHAGPLGEKASIVKWGIGVEVKAPAGVSILEPDDLHPPPGDRSLLAIVVTELLWLDDGNLVIGLGDGSVTAVDRDQKRLWTVGFRGAVRGLVSTEQGQIAVTTDAGVVALVSPEGKVRWERQIMADDLTPVRLGPKGLLLVAGPRGVLAFSPEGELVFSHAASLPSDICCDKDPKTAFSVDASTGRVKAKDLDFGIDDPHIPIPSPEPSFSFSYEKVFPDGVFSLLASGPDELYGIAVAGDKKYEVVRLKDGKVKRIPIPQRSARAEVVDEETKKRERPRLDIDGIVNGPNGNPWLLARRVFDPEPGQMYWGAPAASQLLELKGDSVRERNDLQKEFEDNPATTSSGTMMVAAREGTANLFCYGYDSGHGCGLWEKSGFRPVESKNKVISVNRVGDKTMVVTDARQVFRLDGASLVPVESPKGALYGTFAVAGTGDADRWFVSGPSAMVFHEVQGKTTPIPTPSTFEGGLVVRAPNDAWTEYGAMHWDGNRWSTIWGAPSGKVVLRGANEVWVGGAKGIFRGIPSSLTPVRVPAAKSADEGALAEAPPLTLGATLAGYAVARTSLVVKGGEPVTKGKRIAVARDGTIWLETWDRLVEVDAEGKATLLRDDEKRISFDRWFFPEARGRGILSHRERESEAFNERDTLLKLEDGKTAPADVLLLHQDVVAIDGNGSGVTWILGTTGAGSPWSAKSSRPFELAPHALVRAEDKGKFLPVLGLPSANFVDLAVSPDGGAFFVGALNAGPTGEGILFHARGRLGAEGATRYRAPATLFGVAAIANDEAWAVGAAGAILHVKGGGVTRYTLPSGEWLRAVVGSGPNDVWIGGDGGTLIHWNGRELQPVDHGLGAHAAFTGLAISRGTLWAVSPSGIVRIAKSRG